MNITKVYQPKNLLQKIENDFFKDFFFPINSKLSYFNNPLTNILETDKEIKIELSVPGIEKSAIKIFSEDKILKITYENKIENNLENENFIRKEFETSSFSTSFKLPENISVDGIESKMENGILKISIPKLEKKSSIKLIDIQ